MASTLRHGWQELLTAADAWLLRPSEVAPGALRERCLGWLSAVERARYEALRADLRHDYLATRSLCRATLSRYAGVEPSAWRFETSAHGKPAIAEPAAYKSLRFNLTHTSDLLICIVSRCGEVGVDAEDSSRDIDVEEISRHFVSRQEWMRLASLCASERVGLFYEHWVFREAFLKGTGRGVAAAPERFTMSFDDDGRPTPIGGWRFFLHRPSADHVAAAAVRPDDASEPVLVRWLTADAEAIMYARVCR